MFTAARLAISAWRNEDLSYLLRVRGPDLSGGTALRLQVRLAPGTPGDPLLSLDRVADDTLGLKVIDTRVVDGVIETLIRCFVPAARLQALPFDGELGEPFPLAFAFQIAGKTRLHGDLILLDSAIDSDGNSDEREPAYGATAARFTSAPQQGATLTIGADEVVEVTIDGADLYGPAIERAVDALDTVEGIAGSSYRAVPTYGDREAIPLDKRENGLRVQVMQAGQDANGFIPRVFEWRTDLFAPGGWTGLLTEEELTRLDLMHGGLAQDKVYGLAGTLDAIRGENAALAAVKVGGLRAQLLAGGAATIAWTRDGGRPQTQAVSWSGWTVPLRGDAERFELRDWSKIEQIFVAGNSLSDITGATDQWSQLLAAFFKVPLVSIARGSSDARQVYKAGAAPLVLTLAGALPATGSVAVTLINGVAPSLDSYVSPASFLGSYGGDATPAAMTGWASDGVIARRVTVSIPRGDSVAYRMAQDAGGTAVTFAGPVTFTPDTASEMSRSLVGLWLGNNYFYSGVPGEFGDYTNAQLWRDLDALVQQAAGARIFVLPILPAADWTERGPGTPYNAYLAANARTRARYPQGWLLDALGRDLVKYIQALGSDGSAGDQADVAADFIPRSSRYDGLHLNAKGVALVVAFLKEALALQPLLPAPAEGTMVRLTATGGGASDSAFTTVIRADRAAPTQEAWLYVGATTPAPLMTDLVGNVLQAAQGPYLYSSRDPADPADLATFRQQMQKAGLDGVWTHSGAGGVLTTDLVGNVLSYAAGGTIYTIPDPADPLLGKLVTTQLAAAGVGEQWTYVGTSDVLITDLVGNVLASTKSLTQPTSALRRIAPVPLKPAQIVTARRDWTGVLVAGQSLTTGEHAYGIISDRQPFANLTFGSGPGSTKAGSVGVNASPGTSTSIPLVETIARAEDAGAGAGETPCSGIANFSVERALRRGLIGTSDEYVGFAWTAGHTGYSIDQLSADSWFQLLRDQVDGFVALAVAAGKTRAIPAIYWIQGNADVDAGTGFAGYQAKLKAYRAKVEAYVQSKIPDNGPVALIMVQTEYKLSVDPSIALAQVALARSEPHFYMVGPTFHLPHYSNESHLVKEGYKWAGCYFGRAKVQLELEQVAPDWLQLLSVSCFGSDVTFRFRVPVQPIVIDEALCGPTTQAGLAVKDSDGLVPLSNVRVTGPDEITATCARVPKAGATGRVGLDYRGLNIRLGNACTSNVRDSDDETCVVAGVARSLWRVAPAQESTILFLQG